MIQLYRRPDGVEVYQISSGDFWLPGGYATPAAARYAFQLTDAELKEVNDRVYSIHGEDRPITSDDLKAVVRARKDQP